jgi:protein SCO1/2
MHRKNRDILFGITAVIVLAVIALLVIELANRSRERIEVYGQVPEFDFVEMDGESFGSEDMLGTISIVNFFFTSCKGPCPYMNSKVAELYRKYITTDQVRFISISVDPATDSLHVLKKYAQEYGAGDDRWLFLRGDIDQVQQLTEEGFKLAGELPNLHSTKLILVDRKGNIRGYYDSFDEESLNLLTIHVRSLLYRG